MKLPPPFHVWNEQIRGEVGGARVLFTTRRGGFSTGAYESLNLGRLTEDAPEAVTRNRYRIETMIGQPVAKIRQVHGTRVVRVESPAPADAPIEEADGQATVRHGVAPVVLVADCLPIVVAGDDGLALLHAGWRGLANGIVEQGVRALRELGCEGRLEAAIGPGAGPCCYEVGEEVHQRFLAYGDRARRGRNLAMGAVASAQLQSHGVQVVHDVGLCTICSDASLFFSHRRDHGVTGRQAGIAWLS